MADKHNPQPGSASPTPGTRPGAHRDEPSDDSPLDSLGKAIVDPVLSSQPTTPADVVHERRHPDEKKR